MRVLVTGDRNWNNFKVIKEQLYKLPPSTIIVHGNARGADRVADTIANNELGLTVIRYPADWQKYGKAAGVLRNKDMIESEIDLTLAFHDSITKSKGTKDSVKRSISKGIKTILYRSDGRSKILNEQFTLL